MIKPYELEIINSLKNLLQTCEFSSQLEIVVALSSLGFENVTQGKVSRLLKKIDATKTRNHNNKIIYSLSDKRRIPNKNQVISSVIIEVKHNGFQIVIKTIKGAGKLISNIIESFLDTFGVIGCMASDDTILIIPSNVTLIDENIAVIMKHLDASYYN